MEWWKNLFAPLLVAAILGIGGWIWSHANAPDAPIIEVTEKSVSVPNVYRKEYSDLKVGDPTLPGVPPPEVLEALKKLRFEASVTFTSLTISNNGVVRTSGFDLSAERSILLYQEKDKSTFAYETMKLPQLAPSSKIVVTLITPTYYLPGKILLLHGDKQIAKFPEEKIPHPDPSFIFYLLAGFFLIGLPWLIIAVRIGLEKRPEDWAKEASSAEVRRYENMLKVVQQRYPEKLQDKNQEPDTGST